MSLYEQLCKIISTHSAHEDGDCMFYILTVYHGYFNPLRPRGRRRLYAAYHYPGRGFQPTPPTRTETICISPWLTGSGIFQPTPPTRTETVDISYGRGGFVISTHSAHEDGDLMVKLSLKYNKRFQPTPPTRTETRGAKIPLYPFRYFNPLRPRGRRPAAMPTTHSIPRFQPTPPTRTETAILHKKTNNSSSHFHNQITSYPLKSPPTYPAHIQNRSHCAVFPVRIPP